MFSSCSAGNQTAATFSPRRGKVYFVCWYTWCFVQLLGNISYQKLRGVFVDFYPPNQIKQPLGDVKALLVLRSGPHKNPSCERGTLRTRSLLLMVPISLTATQKFKIIPLELQPNPSSSSSSTRRWRSRSCPRRRSSQMKALLCRGLGPLY